MLRSLPWSVQQLTVTYPSVPFSSASIYSTQQNCFRCNWLARSNSARTIVSESGSITQWVKQLQDGERAAVQRLWEAYVRKLIQLAHKKLQGLPPQLADPEDVALSAFKSFCRAVEENR